MIVDVHYHLIPYEWNGEPLWDFRAARIMGRQVDREELIKKAAESYPDPTGERVLTRMQEAGIDFTVVCTADDVEDPFHADIMTQNQMVANVAQKHPNRLMALAGIDPRRPNAPDLLKRCFEEFGMKGLKYHPGVGFAPNSPESYKLLEIVQNYDGILLVHTGPLFPPYRSKYSDSMLLADIGVDFPNLKVIAAHMGEMNWRPWAALASFQPNLYGDLAMWDAFAFGHYEFFCRELRALIDYAGVEKVLFGTDNPAFSLLEPSKNWIQLIKDLPTNAPTGIKFTEDEVNAILGENAASLLEL